MCFARCSCTGCCAGFDGSKIIHTIEAPPETRFGSRPTLCRLRREPTYARAKSQQAHMTSLLHVYLCLHNYDRITRAKAQIGTCDFLFGTPHSLQKKGGRRATQKNPRFTLVVPPSVKNEGNTRIKIELEAGFKQLRGFFTGHKGNEPGILSYIGIKMTSYIK